MTIVVVLSLIAITLALSYSILRSQMTSMQIQANSDRSKLARQAAITGLSVGLRKIHQSSWGGTLSSIAGTISNYESYLVTYTAGDASLTSGNADYADLPYRVTITSVGTSQDPAHSNISSTDTVEAVVRLVCKQVTTPPSTWRSMQAFTVYQKDAQDFTVDVPCRIEGPLRVQGAFKLGEEYSWSTTARQRYMSDLNAMRTNGYADYRPVNGPISMPLANSDATNKGLLTDKLMVTVGDIPIAGRPTIPFPAALTSYRIYTGGPLYQVPQLSSSLQNVTYAPDPATNPLGIYFAPADTTLHSGVSITGTLVGAGSIHVAEPGVQLIPFDMRPLLSSASSPIRLPTVVAGGDFVVDAGGGGGVGGIVLANGAFGAARGAASSSFQLTGRVIADEFHVYERSNWDLSSGAWAVGWTLFTNQLSQPPASRVNYFPVYLGNLGMNPIPLLTIKPDLTSLTPHWQDLAQPVYVADPADPGLRWDLVRWTDKP